MGNVWATKKTESLTGQAFLLVETEGGDAAPLICADQTGAGPGDRVLVALGGAARVAAGERVPVDAAIVGIVDHMESNQM